MEPYVTEETLEVRSRLWLEKISDFNQHMMDINKDKSALLVVDMQKFFFESHSKSLPNLTDFIILPIALKKFMLTIKRREDNMITSRRLNGRCTFYELNNCYHKPLVNQLIQLNT
jgi:hypothetical protein